MNKKELINIVSEKRDLTKKDAEILVNTVFDTMVESMIETKFLFLASVHLKSITAMNVRVFHLRLRNLLSFLQVVQFLSNQVID